MRTDPQRFKSGRNEENKSIVSATMDWPIPSESRLICLRNREKSEYHDKRIDAIQRFASFSVRLFSRLCVSFRLPPFVEFRSAIAD